MQLMTSCGHRFHWPDNQVAPDSVRCAPCGITVAVFGLTHDQPAAAVGDTETPHCPTCGKANTPDTVCSNPFHWPAETPPAPTPNYATPETFAEAVETLRAFVRTAPGRLPERVTRALELTEAP